jgi:Glycosyltransferases involved in cell wall biogenesis
MTNFPHKPIISVVIPAYNCSQYIEQAILSALAQEVSLEIIIINDQSPDNLDEVMEKYLTNPKIIYLKNPVNLGVVETRNKGVAYAQGQYIAFLDADDWWEGQKLQAQLDLMQKEDAVLCSTARELCTATGAKTGKIITVSNTITYAKLLRHNIINCSSVLLKKEVADEFPMAMEDSHEDYYTWLCILKKYGKACGINEPYLKYRMLPKSKSGNKWRSIRMTYKVYRYMGYNHLYSSLFWCSYIYNGVKKHYLNFLFKSNKRDVL